LGTNLRQIIAIEPMSTPTRGMEIVHQQRRGIVTKLKTVVGQSRCDPERAEDRMRQRAPMRSRPRGRYTLGIRFLTSFLGNGVEKTMKILVRVAD